MFVDTYVWDLSLDWVTGNLYGVDGNGYVFVCNTTNSESLNCKSLLTGPGVLCGIIVEPNSGFEF